MKITLNDLKVLASVKSESELFESKHKLLSSIARLYQEKKKQRANVSYVNQKSQALVKNNCYNVINTKYSSSEVFEDILSIDKSEVKKLQALKLSYEEFKTLFLNVSKFILCNYSTRDNLAKHERFYSQCLAEINVILLSSKRFTESIIHSRSRNIEVKQITHDNIEKAHKSFMSELFESKSKSKASKLVKATTSKRASKKAITVKQ